MRTHRYNKRYFVYIILYLYHNLFWQICQYLLADWAVKVIAAT